MSVAKWAIRVTKRIIAGTHNAYRRARKEPLCSKSCLFESDEGRVLDSNLFSLLRELSWSDRSAYHTLYVVSRSENAQRMATYLARYGIAAQITLFGSDEYEELLARCKFVFANGKLASFFSKRQGQVYVNVGDEDALEHARSIMASALPEELSSAQRNLLACDYALFTSAESGNDVMELLNVASIMSAHAIHRGNPRADALHDLGIAAVARELEGLQGKRAVAFLPLWRGTSSSTNVPKQAEIVRRVAAKLEAALDENTVIYVCTHYLLAGALRIGHTGKLRLPPSDFDLYDMLSACDLAVTNRSSVASEFVASGRPVVWFDCFGDESAALAEGPSDRLAPYVHVRSLDELGDSIRSCLEEGERENLAARAGFKPAGIASSVLGSVLEGKVDSHVSVLQPKRNLRLVYADGIDNKANVELLVKDMLDKRDGETVLAFMSKPRVACIELMNTVPESVPYIVVGDEGGLEPLPAFCYALSRHSALAARLTAPLVRKGFDGEGERLLPGLKPVEARLHVSQGSYGAFVAGSYDCPTSVLAKDAESFFGEQRTRMASLAVLCKCSTFGSTAVDPSLLTSEARKTYFDDLLQANLITRIPSNTDTSVGVRGLMCIRMPKNASPSSLSLELALGQEDAQSKQRQLCGRDVASFGHIEVISKRSGILLAKYRIDVPSACVNELPTHTPIVVHCKDDNGCEGSVHVGFGLFDLRRSTRTRLKPLLDEKRNTALFFRHAYPNKMSLTVRQINPTDRPKGRALVECASLLARIRPYDNAIVLFEKNASRYEESASVLFESLMDSGLDDVWFVLDKRTEYFEHVPDRYRTHIVDRNSLKHYRLFFSAKTFIGTEMLVHCAELTTSNKKIAKRLESPALNYVFLQHGVMYMVSLDSESRTFFKPRKTTSGLYRVVVSSEAEKRHFIDRAGYDDEMLYVCGLPKFDRCSLVPGADLVTVMPTWRPWEANAARVAFAETGYYRFLARIIESIPCELADKLVVLAHPLFAQYLAGQDVPFMDKLDFTSHYSDILAHTKVLVTDYSSIAYDAFYRGSNVVFDWSDKDECMRHYGPSTELMIDEETAFGAVVHTNEELTRFVREAYGSDQSDVHKERYQQIVQFHDGCNTQRLISMLRRDELL